MKWTLLFFKWTVNHWEQLRDNRVGESTMDKEIVAGARAYAARQAALYRKLINIFIQDWYECLETKSLRSGWLSEYPRPEACRRRRLQSNVATYHLFTPHVDDMDSALENNSASNSEDSVTVTGDSDVKMDFFDG